MTKRKMVSYHTFKRINPDHPEDVMKVRALVKPATTTVTIKLREPDILDALKRDGQADSQNCAGAICACRHKKLFNHPVGQLIDWWRRRVYICEPLNVGRRKNQVCYMYGHYDHVDELFDPIGGAGIKRLLKRVRKEGHIDVTLYPVRRGYHPVTGKTITSGTDATKSGDHRKPMRGSELRLWTYSSGRIDKKPPHD